MEETQSNPLLEQEDYFAGYQKSIEGLKNKPEVISFDKLCYELFEHNELGRKFMDLIRDRYFVASFPGINRGTTTYQLDLLWVEGFRDAFRIIMQSVNAHNQRIKSEMNHDGR